MLNKMKTRRALAIALAAVMALSTPMMSFAETSGEEIVEEVVQEPVAEEVMQEPGAEEVTQEPVAAEVTEELAIEEVVQESVTEEVITPSDPEVIEISSPSEDAEEDEEIIASSSEIILEDTAEDGMKVTLKADLDTFEYSEGLSLDVSIVSEEEAEEADKELKQETKNDNIAKRVTYDIRVMHGDEELEPLDGKKVKVELTMADIPSGADAVNVYHIDEEDGVETIVENAPVNEATGSEASLEDNAVVAGESAIDTKDAEAEEIDEEDIFEDGDILDDVTIEGETDSFSLYTVDFTYEEKTISIPGDTTGNLLSDILTDVGITDSITGVEVYSDDSFKVKCEDGVVRDGDNVLFKVYNDNGTWYVDAVNAFNTTHGIIVKTENASEKGYEIKITDEQFSLKFTAEQDGSTIALDWVYAENVRFTVDDKSYNYTQNKTYTFNKGQVISFVASTIRTDGDHHFKMTGKISVSGPIDNLLTDDVWHCEPLPESCFNCLFKGCTALLNAPEMPTKDSKGNDMKLSAHCYEGMFEGCSSLTKAPTLPAETLASYCYKGMFKGCSSIKEAPELKASTMYDGCYENMFENCYSLTTAPQLNSQKIATSCYKGMFKNCTSLKAFSLDNLPAETLANYCYEDMFYGCTSLTKAPGLLAKKLKSGCYNGMNICTLQSHQLQA